MPSIKIMNDFEAFLLSKKLQFEGIAVGGSALILLGVIDRATRDLDLVNQSIPEAILEAAKQFSQLHSLDENWLNNGPREITKHLPTGWQERLTPLFNGKALKLFTLNRKDLIKTKCWALCDRAGSDQQDLLQLKPSKIELLEAIEWLKPLDQNTDWSDWVERKINRMIAILEKKT